MIGSILVWIVVGAIGGWLAGYILTRDTTFNLQDVILGMVGAVVGGWLSSVLLHVDPNGISPLAILMAVLGSIIVAYLFKRFMGKSVT